MIAPNLQFMHIQASSREKPKPSRLHRVGWPSLIVCVKLRMSATNKKPKTPSLWSSQTRRDMLGSGFSKIYFKRDSRIV